MPRGRTFVTAEVRDWCIVSGGTISLPTLNPSSASLRLQVPVDSWKKAVSVLEAC
jgi:hypothetical protein